jgi:hypothetical protein
MVSGLIHLFLTYASPMKSLMFYSSSPTTAEVVPLFGLLAYICMSVMALMAFEPIRRLNYELFLSIHKLYIPAIVLLILHVPKLAYGFIPGVLLHICDFVLLIRAYRHTSVATCVCTRVSEKAEKVEEEGVVKGGAEGVTRGLQIVTVTIPVDAKVCV